MRVIDGAAYRLHLCATSTSIARPHDSAVFQITE